MSESQLSISRYKGGRHWAVRETDTDSLVAVMVYRKGAVEVVRRLMGAIPELPKRRTAREGDDFSYKAGGKP